LSWLRTEGAPWLGLVRGVVEQQGEVDGLDAGAHLTVLGSMMLTHAALHPSRDRRWRARLAKAALRVMERGSGIGS